MVFKRQDIRSEKWKKNKRRRSKARPMIAPAYGLRKLPGHAMRGDPESTP